MRIGSDWMTDRKGNSKIASVDIEPIDLLKTDNPLLIKFVEYSGFTSLEEWLEVIKIPYRYLPQKGWLYKVKLVESTHKRTK